MIGYLTVEQLRDMLAAYPDHAPVAVVVDDEEFGECETGHITLGWAGDGVVEIRTPLG